MSPMIGNAEIMLLGLGVIVYTLATMYVAYDAGRRTQMLKPYKQDLHVYKARIVMLGKKGTKNERYQAIMYGPRGVRVVTDAEKNPAAARNRLEQICHKWHIVPKWEEEIANG